MNTTVGAISSPNFGATMTQVQPSQQLMTGMRSITVASPTIQDNYTPTAQLRQGSVATQTAPSSLTAMDQRIAGVAKLFYDASLNLAGAFQPSNAVSPVATGHSFYAMA